MHFLENVKTTLKKREREIITLAKKNEKLNNLSTTLLDSLQTILRHSDVAMSYDERKGLKKETESLVSSINAHLMVEETDVIKLKGES